MRHGRLYICCSLYCLVSPCVVAHTKTAGGSRGGCKLELAPPPPPLITTSHPPRGSGVLPYASLPPQSVIDPWGPNMGNMMVRGWCWAHRVRLPRQPCMLHCFHCCSMVASGDGSCHTLTGILLPGRWFISSLPCCACCAAHTAGCNEEQPVQRGRDAGPGSCEAGHRGQAAMPRHASHRRTARKLTPHEQ